MKCVHPQPARARTALRLLTRVWIALAALSLLAFAADAEECSMGPRVPFEGHNMPATGLPVPQGYKLVDAFPGLPLRFPSQFEHDNTWQTHITAPPRGGAPPPDDRGTMFVVERNGRIIVFDNDSAVDHFDVFLDIRGRVQLGNFEPGLLGLAFDPDYENNGTFYINYVGKPYDPNDPATCAEEIEDRFCTKVVRYRTRDGNPRSADPATEELILEFGQPGIEHNGGMLAFGPDGMLYISAGDGIVDLDHPDPGDRAQNTSILNGSILRIDVHGAEPGEPYAIPGDNPFGNEVFHYGLRNPWRFSFDREPPHDLWIGDVGQENWEEIDRVLGGAPGGVNFGWDICEGTHDVLDSDCEALAGATPPLIEYRHEIGGGGSVIGGYVYRGSAFPELYGHYIFTDFSRAEVYAWDREEVNASTGLGAFRAIASGNPIGSMGEDQDGELYFVETMAPRIYTLARCEEGDGCYQSPESVYPEKLSQTGFFSDTESLVPAPGMIEYAVNSALWSDHAEKRRWVALPGSEKIHFDSSRAWSFPVGTALVKHFELLVSAGTMRRLETRILFRQGDRWTGVTYRWDEDQKDATMLRQALLDRIPVDIDELTEQEWAYPSPTGCKACHNDASGTVLGLRTRQLNGYFPYDGGPDNQLDAWNCIGLFDTNIGASEQFDLYAPLDDDGASLRHRSRSYMASNCAHCHQLGGGVPGGLDMRYGVLLGNMRIIGRAATLGSLGASDPERIKPGFKEESVLWLRQNTLDAARRMAAGTFVPHAEAVDVFGDWIDFGLATLDSEDDGIADEVDNCPDVANPGQGDRDGDGTGDACDPDILPDLVGSPIGPAAAEPGGAVALVASVTNEAGRDAAPPSQVTAYLSEDESPDRESDLLLLDCFVGELSGGEEKTCGGEVRIPAEPFGLPPYESGEYHWIACADILRLVRESDESNNCVSAPVTIPEPSLFLAQLLAVTLLASAARRRT